MNSPASPLRKRLHVATIVIVSALCGSLLTGTAMAYQQLNMENARDNLYSALQDLQQANSDKGGHRVAAMNLVQQAIGEVNAGIAYANGNDYYR